MFKIRGGQNTQLPYLSESTDSTLDKYYSVTSESCKGWFLPK